MNNKLPRWRMLGQTLVLFLLFAGAARAQNTGIVEDTLDWRRYFPLEIGNTWEYGGLNAYTSTIIGDTLTDDHRYFIRRDSIPAVGTLGPFIHTFYHRYDSTGTVITLLDLEEDTLALPLSLDYRRTESPDFLAYFDMRMAFGDTLYYGAPDTLYHVSGGFAQQQQIGSELVLVDGLKCFGAQGDLVHMECYATDIGFVESRNLYGSTLEYARVGGIEYGTGLSQSRGDEPVLPERLVIESIFPNPFRGRTTVSFRLSRPSPVTVEVFNALGQRILREGSLVQSTGVGTAPLQGEGWAPGLYLIRLSTEGGEQTTRPVVVIR